MKMEQVDLLVIGGGVNGTGIARDAAGRGLSVMLLEKEDLASSTSSKSTKLIHGGLRYLEHYEFRLVRSSLIEREVLWRAAPHFIWPLRFVLPHHKGLRPLWLLRLGLFLYDHIGGRKKLPATQTQDLKKGNYKGILNKRFGKGFEYSDCWVDDARLVVHLALDAAGKGAQILTRTPCTRLERGADGWRVTYTPEGEAARQVRARIVVNAAGPFVEDIAGIAGIAGVSDDADLRLVKGSHIITRKLYKGEHCYIFQNADGRVVFAIPYEENFTLIGTTDVPFDPTRDKLQASDQEKQYLVAAVNEYFEKQVTVTDIIWSYSGVRPLYDDQAENASAVTRDYVLKLDEKVEGAPILSVYGGKITTFRKLAEHVLAKLEKYLPSAGPVWTAEAFLPGATREVVDFEAFMAARQRVYGWLERAVVSRLCRLYGSRIDDLLAGAEDLNDMGVHFGAGLYEKEVAFLREQEWAKSAEDILWRRTKVGLHMTEKERYLFTEWFNQASVQMF